MPLPAESFSSPCCAEKLPLDADNNLKRHEIRHFLQSAKVVVAIGEKARNLKIFDFSVGYGSKWVQTLSIGIFCMNYRKTNLVVHRITVSNQCGANKMNIHLPRFSEETRLISLIDEERRFRLQPETFEAWKKMKAAAESDGIDLHIISAFRSVARQSEIIEEKKRNGIPEAVIFNVSAPPNHSEHHTGRAIDIGTRDFADLEEAFENSEAFCWLAANGRRFGFRLSYPRENPYGIAYESWHWFFEGIAQQNGGTDCV